MSSITSFNRNGGSFLTFNSHPPRVYLASSSPVSERALLSWKEEGFDAQLLTYHPLKQAAYIHALRTLGDSLNLGEQYAIIAYGDAANIVLKTAIKPLSKCCAIVVFYPSLLPNPKQLYPASHELQIHMAGLNQVSPCPDMHQGKLYRYENCKAGFADSSSAFYSEIEANLSWSRSLACLRKAFNRSVDLESVVQTVWNAKYQNNVPERASMDVVLHMTQNSPHVTVLPTLEGGIGRKRLEEFYREFFIPSLVDDFHIRLVSRTVGVDRVVDEMVVSFTHSGEMDWILPGVPPTYKFVEIPMVSIVMVRGGKLASEHMYWDQASVLTQTGLLNSHAVPEKFKSKGLKLLPVTGAEAAQQLLDPQQQRYNKLL